MQGFSVADWAVNAYADLFDELDKTSKTSRVIGRFMFHYDEEALSLIKSPFGRVFYRAFPRRTHLEVWVSTCLDFNYFDKSNMKYSELEMLRMSGDLMKLRYPKEGNTTLAKSSITPILIHNEDFRKKITALVERKGLKHYRQILLKLLLSVKGLKNMRYEDVLVFTFLELEPSQVNEFRDVPTNLLMEMV